MFGSDSQKIDFRVNLIWSSKTGFRVEGQNRFNIIIPIHQQLLNFIEIDTLFLELNPIKDGQLSFDASLGANFSLGPISVNVNRVGIKLIFEATDDGRGNLGLINLNFGFRPPNGVGLAIDATAVVGVGYLEFDFDKQTYSGFVYLEIAESLSVTAVGLITTKMPDGSPGFSMLILIAVQFSPALQLGYGFTLNGLGGLLGINRTAAVDVLRQGLRSGTLGSILFPDDPVHNAAKIVSDLGSVFSASTRTICIWTNGHPRMGAKNIDYVGTRISSGITRTC